MNEENELEDNTIRFLAEKRRSPSENFFKKREKNESERSL